MMNQTSEKNYLTNKIDFAVIFSVRNANPNGDPLNQNLPRQDYEGHGEVSDVCLKRKIRNRLLDMGESIYVQSDDRRVDDFRSLKDRFDDAKIKGEDMATKACDKWFDVRAFGQVFAFKGKGSKKNEATKEDSENSDAVSIGIRGPVTIQSAFSLETINPCSLQITKSVNLETDKKQPDRKGSDTIGMKHRIDKAVYVTYGAISPQLASKTYFSDIDAEKIKLALQTLFKNDESSARPAGSMIVLKVIWWKHNCQSGQYSSAQVHDSLRKLILGDGTFDEMALNNSLPGLVPKLLEELVDAPTISI